MQVVFRRIVTDIAAIQGDRIFVDKQKIISKLKRSIVQTWSPKCLRLTLNIFVFLRVTYAKKILEISIGTITHLLAIRIIRDSDDFTV